MIRLNDIVVKFGDFTALHSINVHVKEGEFLTANFEFYTSDNFIGKAKEGVEKRIEGHLIVEGAKKYLEQVGEY